MPAGLGDTLDVVWALPFAGLLLTIALAPLLTPRFWHHHYGKVAAFWGIGFGLPFAALYGVQTALHTVLDACLLEYLPFIVLLGALYIVAAGIRLTGTPHATPAVNSAFLLGGMMAASIVGTTGAAMLLIRPLIRANRRRRHVTHVIVFFIVLVASIGGALSPLGDPPLFLGFLQGVPFFWPTRYLAAPTAAVGLVLLVLFYAIDSHYHRRTPRGDPSAVGEIEKLGIAGKGNLILLLAITAIVLLSGIWQPGIVITVLDVPLAGQRLLAIVPLVAVSGLSLHLTPPGIRHANDFAWAPILEVAILFAAIFLTIVPVLAILHHRAADGVLGRLDDRSYFWATGLLSAFLDNAPTYLLFFNLAGGDAADLAGPQAATLIAISAGSVFFGALTYIGNAPNLMVKAIAEKGAS